MTGGMAGAWGRALMRAAGVVEPEARYFVDDGPRSGGPSSFP